ncbi:hypothetical protein MTO96_020441 [Rhipicephalus appendiculatus]
MLSETRRAAYELPDGVEFVVGGVQTTFQCERSGYFADVSNNCQLFHICNEIYKEDGSVELQQYSFFCGNQTVFNQLSLTCAHPEESVPCQNAPRLLLHQRQHRPSRRAGPHRGRPAARSPACAGLSAAAVLRGCLQPARNQSEAPEVNSLSESPLSTYYPYRMCVFDALV